MSSPRLSSRLAEKRTTNKDQYHSKRDDFEYTPIGPRAKSEPSREGSVGKPGNNYKNTKCEEMQPQADRADFLLKIKTFQNGTEETDEMPSTSPKKRKRGRPPKVINLGRQPSLSGGETDKITSEENHMKKQCKEKVEINHAQRDYSDNTHITELTRRKGRPPKVVHLSRPSPSSSSGAQTDIEPGLEMKEQLKAVLDKIYSQSGVVDDIKYPDKVFPLVAALFPSDLVSALPGGIMETMRAVGKETGVHWETHKEETQILYGSLGSLNKASVCLDSLIHKNEDVLKSLTETETAPVNEDPPSADPDQGVRQTTIIYLQRVEDVSSQENGTFAKPEAVEMDPEVLINGVTLPDEITELPSGETSAQAAANSTETGININDKTCATEESGELENAPEYEVNGCVKTEQIQQASPKSPTPPQNHSRTYRRQLYCQHKLANCDICQSYCDQCHYRSTEVGLRKHKQRVHPSVTYPCQVCDMAFGIRYDMRRHRLVHFDFDGNLTKQGRKSIEKSKKTPDEKKAMLKLTLADYETNFTPCTTESEDFAAGQQETTLDPSISDPGLVKCGYCDTHGTLDELEAHHAGIHQVIGSHTLSYQCSNCAADFYPLDQLTEHCRQGCGRSQTETHKSGDHTADASCMDGVLIKCRICEVTCADMGAITEHITTHPMLLECAICKETGTSADIMGAHLKEHTTSEMVPSQTPENESGKPRARPRCKAEHQHKPPKETSVLYKCGLCERLFKTRGSLHIHFKTHQDKELLVCHLCGYSTEKRGQYNIHMQSKHTAMEDRQCDICSKIFAQPSTLKFHRESVHGIGRKLQSCHICNKQFTAKRFLQVHFDRIHAKVQRFFCPVCQKGFFDRARMLQHHQTHLPEEEKTKKFVCSFCARAFGQKATLRQHENTHKGIKPYKCKLCPKAFCFSSQLTKHYTAHNSARPHICPLCGKGFKFRYKLTAHTTTHTKQGRFSCQECGRVYTARATLRKHVCKARLMDDVMALKQEAELKAKMRIPASSSGVLLMDPDVSNHQNANHQSMFIQTLKQESNTGQTDVMDILGVDHGQMIEILPESEIGAEVTTIMHSSQLALENKEDYENSGPEAQTNNSAGVLYMCSICNHLFQFQADVNAHMNTEHGAEAVISTDQEQQLEELQGCVIGGPGEETIDDDCEYLVQHELKTESDG